METHQPYNQDQLAAMLPKVGDVRQESPTVGKAAGYNECTPPAKRCTVVQVNADKLWYRVQFDDGGTECYKLPRLDPKERGLWHG
jgi:hypothetical protein